MMVTMVLICFNGFTWDLAFVEWFFIGISLF